LGTVQYKLSSQFTTWQIVCVDVTPRCHEWEMHENQLEPFLEIGFGPFSETPTNLHSRTTTDRRIFFTSSFTPFEVLVIMIVLQSVKALYQSSGGTTHNCNKGVHTGE
jgi:hypothetical protein